MVEVFKKGFVTGFDMFCGVLAASCSVACLCMSAWGFYLGLIGNSDDEVDSLFALLGMVALPPAVLFGYWANGESWVFVLVTGAVVAWIFCIRFLLALDDSK